MTAKAGKANQRQVAKGMTHTWKASKGKMIQNILKAKRMMQQRKSSIKKLPKKVSTTTVEQLQRVLPTRSTAINTMTRQYQRRIATLMKANTKMLQNAQSNIL